MRILPILGVLAVIVYVFSLWFQYKYMIKEQFEESEPSGDYPQVYTDSNQKPCYVVPTSSPSPTTPVPITTTEPSWVSRIKSGTPSPSSYE